MKALFRLFSVLFIIGIVFASASTAKAQTVTFTPTGSGDTVVNAGTQDLIYRLAPGYETISFNAILTKISGTVAGTAIFQGSLNGTNYTNLDTLTLTDVATQHQIFYQDNRYYYYRVLVTGSGTMSAKVTGVVLPRK